MLALNNGCSVTEKVKNFRAVAKKNLIHFHTESVGCVASFSPVDVGKKCGSKIRNLEKVAAPRATSSRRIG